MGKSCSPGMPSGAWLVARTVTWGQRMRTLARAGAAPRTCSRLSRTSSRGRSWRTATSWSSGASWASLNTPKVWTMAGRTCVGSWMEARETKATASPASARRAAATWRARRVLPTPPGPVRVMRRWAGSASRARSCSDSRARPSRGVSSTGSGDGRRENPVITLMGPDCPTVCDADRRRSASQTVGQSGPMSVITGFSRRPSPLPVELTPLLGRARESEQLLALLADPAHRLITLTGPGGVGKTRLALHVAAALRADAGAAVAFVSLASIQDPTHVLPAIVQTFGVFSDAQDAPEDQLVAVLHDRPLLLVLDNLEQVLGAAPALANVLMRCPHVTVLATSQAPLGIPGEQLFPIYP